MKTNEIIEMFDIIAFVASIGSIILAILAIILSIVFYKWSDQSNKAISKVSVDIENNTKKLENLFDKLYSDTFNLMKSNVEALQKKAYQSEIISGDSGLSKIEQIEEIIFSIVQRSKTENKDELIKFIKNSRLGVTCRESDIILALENLEIRESIIIETNSIKLGQLQTEMSGNE
jgi:hypothetical protein